MIEQKWCTTDGTSWTLSHGKYWARIELSFDNTCYSAWWGRLDSCLSGKIYDEALDLPFDCLKKAKAACVRAIKRSADAYVELSLEVEP